MQCCCRITNLLHMRQSLMPSGKDYAQIKKRDATVFGTERFHQYIYTTPVDIITDQPLEAISMKPLSAAPRWLQGMMLCLQKCDINALHKPGKNTCCASISGWKSHFCEEYDRNVIIKPQNRVCCSYLAPT